MIKLFCRAAALRFVQSEDGLALTEYLVLLGLLITGIIGAVVAFGNGVTNTYESWALWISGLSAPS